MTFISYCRFCLLLCGLVISTLAVAQLNGHNLRGDYGLASGSQPAPGSYWASAVFSMCEMFAQPRLASATTRHKLALG